MSELEAEAPDLDTAALADGVAAGDVADAAPPEAAPEAVQAPVEAPWAPDRDEWNQIVQTNQYLAQILAEAQQQPDEPADVPDPSLDPAGYADYIRDSVMQAVAPIVQPARAQAAEQQVTQWFDQAQAKVGEFDRDHAAYVAHGFMPRDPNTGEVIRGYEQQAIQQAAQYTAERDAKLAKAAGEAAVEAYKKQLETVAGARGEPAGGTSLGVESGPPPTSILEAGRRFAANLANERRAG